MEDSSVKTIRDTRAVKPTSATPSVVPTVNQSLQNLTENLIRIYESLNSLEQRQTAIEKSITDGITPISNRLSALEKSIKELSVLEEIEIEDHGDYSTPSTDDYKEDVCQILNSVNKISSTTERKFTDVSSRVGELITKVEKNTAEHFMSAGRISAETQELRRDTAAMRAEVTALQHSMNQIVESQKILHTTISDLTDRTTRSLNDIREDALEKEIDDIDVLKDMVKNQREMSHNLRDKQSEILLLQSALEDKLTQMSWVGENTFANLESLSTKVEDLQESIPPRTPNLTAEDVRKIFQSEFENYRDNIIAGVAESMNTGIPRCSRRSKECARYTGGNKL